MTCLTISDKPLTTIKSKNGAKGSPCLNHIGLNYNVRLPFTSTCIMGMILHIHLIN